MFKLPPQMAVLSQDLWYDTLKTVLAPVVKNQLVNTTISGLENIPPTGPALLVPNHRTMTDPFILSAELPRRVHWVVAAFMSRLPITREMVRSTGNIVLPVSKGGRSQELMLKAKRLLLRGRMVGVFPEGVDNFVNGSPPGTVSPFHSSFARLLMQMQIPDLPVIPIAITGDEEEVLLRIPGAVLRQLDPGNQSWDRGEVLGVVYREARITIGKPLAFDNFYDLPPEREEEAVKRIVKVVRDEVVALAEGKPSPVAKPVRGRKPMTGPLFDESDF